MRQGLRQVRERLTYANVTATIALFVALGGVGYAATQINGKNIKKRSIAGKRLKKNTLGGTEIKESKLGQVPSAANADTATNATKAQRALTLDPDAKLRSGETLTGLWAITGGTAGNASDAIQFVPQLPTNLGAGAVHRLAPGATSAACPAPGQAAAGNLCVYERAGANAAFNTIYDSASGGNGANRRGAVIAYTTSASNGNTDGTWAVTAP